jgi:hypothetical protein
MDADDRQFSRGIHSHYGLREHLVHCCEEISVFAPLINTFALDSIDLSNQLEVTKILYPHYSLHDSTHAASILANIEQFLGSRRIAMLTPTDTWLILMAIYMHDIGMSYKESDIKNLEGKEDFRHFCAMQKTDVRSDMRNAANFILTDNSEIKTIQEICKSMRDKDNVLSAIFQADFYMRQLYAEYFRKQHASLAFDVIRERLNDYMHRNIIPKRLVLQYAKCAVAHGTSFEKLVDDLKYETNGFRNDLAHPRFVAMLLRLGDLFDSDNNRFNSYLYEATGGLSETSQAHHDKHMSIVHILIKENHLEIEADLDGNTSNNSDSLLRAFDATCQWFDWIEKEVKDIKDHWFHMVPDGFPGGPPELTARTIRYGTEVLEKEQMALQYKINYRRAFEYMQGENLYGESLPFCRELIQNAFDATKRQFYRNISRYFSPRQEGLQAENSGYKQNEARVITQKKFPPQESNDPLLLIAAAMFELKKCRKDYFVRLFVLNAPIQNSQPQRTALRFIIDDNGIGINSQALKRMQTVGEEPPEEVRREVRQMPCWLRPTGEFGIGMHSVFAYSQHFYASSFTSDTRERHRLRGDSKEVGGKIFDYPKWIGWNASHRDIERDCYGTTILTDVDIHEVMKSVLPLDQSNISIQNCQTAGEHIQRVIDRMFAENLFPFEFTRCIHQNDEYGDLGCDKQTVLKESLFQSLIDTLDDIDPDDPIASIKNIKNQLERHLYGECIVWRIQSDQGRNTMLSRQLAYRVFYFDSSAQEIVDHKNIILDIEFMPLTITEIPNNRISFKGASMTKISGQINFPYLSYTLHILGRHAKNTITISRDYLLLKSLSSIKADMEDALNGLMLYLASLNDAERTLLLQRADESYAAMILYMWRWIWMSAEAYTVLEPQRQSIRRLIDEILVAADLGQTSCHMLENNTLRKMQIFHCDIVKDPLRFFYTARPIDAIQINLVDDITNINLSKDFIVIPDFLSRMQPNLSMKSICMLERYPSDISTGHIDIYLFAYSFGIGTWDSISIEYIGETTDQNMDSEQKRIMRVLKEQASNSYTQYIPCFEKYKELSIRKYDQDAINRWPLCRAFIRIPFFGEENEAVWNWLWTNTRRKDEAQNRGAYGKLLTKYIDSVSGIQKQNGSQVHSKEAIRLALYRFVDDWK